MDETPRVLIVDDDPDDRLLAEHEIRRGLGECRVTAISTRGELDRVLACDGFDVVVTDYHIGWTDGIHVLAAVRRAWSDVPVIMFTGTGSEEIAVAAMKAGLNDYVLKSARPRGRLLAAVRLALETAQQRRALRDAESRYHDLFESVPVPLFRSTPDGRVLGANRAFVHLLGMPDLATLLAAPAASFYANPDDRDRWQAEVESSGIAQGRGFRIRRQDGMIRQVILNVSGTRGEGGVITHYEGSMEDVTDRRAQEEQIAYAATHDQLTGLPNRRHVEARLALALIGGRTVTPDESFADRDPWDGGESVEVATSDGVRHPVDGAVLAIDIDNLRLVNETLGHVAGDEVLLMVAKLLQNRLPTGYCLSRLNGDNFAVLLTGVSIATASSIAESLRQAIDDHVFNIQESVFSLGVSIGLVSLNRSSTAGELLARADAALQKAKERGQNRVVVYRREEDDAERFAEENHLIVGLKQALREGRYVLHYQPIVRLSDDSVQSYEALLRLVGENGQLVPPGEFLSAAEHFGLMPRLTRWIVEEAVRTLRRWPEIRLYINLSAHCLTSESLLELIEELLERGDVAPERLGFELTETALVQDFVAAERWIARLKARGCRFALDDFGAGFSSFAHLRNLPFDEIKLDGSLIRGIATDPTRRHFAQAIQMLAEATNKEVVAEYVEDEATVTVLRELGVTYGQGFHLGRPGPGPVRN